MFTESDIACQEAKNNHEKKTLMKEKEKNSLDFLAQFLCKMYNIGDNNDIDFWCG